jgi:hypothetical protein
MSETRLIETRLEYRRLSGELESWFDDLKNKDTLQQYVSQLRNLKESLGNMLGRLEAGLDAAAGSRTPGDLYRACRTYDHYLICVRYIWDYYRDKFAQRVDDALVGVVKAADEVVWSCYRTPLENEWVKRRGVLPGPAPLPFVAPWVSPTAMFKNKPLPQVGVEALPEELRTVVLACLDKLPIPVVALTPDCVSSPWVVVHAAHEVGHYAHRAIASGESALEKFKLALQNAVTVEGVPVEPESPPERWETRAEEIFADLFSVHMMGPWVVWALAELLRDTEERMASDDIAEYPPACVRLALMAEAAVLAGASRSHPALNGILATAPAGAGAGPAARRAAADLRLVPRVVKAALTARLTGPDSLQAWCDWQPADYSSQVGAFRQALFSLREPAAVIKKTLHAPRLAASGAVAAWAQLRGSLAPAGAGNGQPREEVAKAEEKRALELQHKFARLVCETIRKNREDDTRADKPVTLPNPESVGETMANILLGATGVGEADAVLDRSQHG